MTVTNAALTPNQQQALDAFRPLALEVVSDTDSLGNDDHTLLRFLDARNYDTAQALKMLQDTQEWRNTVDGVGIDTLYSSMDPFDYEGRGHVFRHGWPLYFHKTDKQGRPINIQAWGNMNLHAMYKQITPAHHLQSIVVNAESLQREGFPGASRAAGHHIETVCAIIDLQNFSVSQFWHTKTVAQQVTKIAQDNYPGTLGTLFMINAPSSFTAVWSVVKRWLSPDTLAKIHILGSRYQETLLEHIDIANLPKQFGGSCVCPGEGSCEHSGAGPWQEGRVGWGPQAVAANEKVVPQMAATADAVVA